jgi:hypothetical protein
MGWVPLVYLRHRSGASKADTLGEQLFHVALARRAVFRQH